MMALLAGSEQAEACKAPARCAKHLLLSGNTHLWEAVCIEKGGNALFPPRSELALHVSINSIE